MATLRKAPILLVIVSTLIHGAVSDARAQDPGNSLKVQRLEFPVTLSSAIGTPEGCSIVGYLYYHGSYRERPLQVVVHGATYTHTYWDFPRVNGVDYSYAHYMTAPDRKYAVLAVDQLAAGESCGHAQGLDGLLVTLDESASALAQVLRQLRSGANPTGYAFSQIVLVGHSAGSITAIDVQAKWHLADALVVTAARHIAAVPLPPGIDFIDTNHLVPILSALPYFTLPAAVRQMLFYYTPGADAAVIAADNATADVWTGGQVATTFLAFLSPLLGIGPLDSVNDVTGPVLIQLGEFDALFPSGSPSTETAQWTNAQVTMQELAGIGHDFNLHLNRQQSWNGIDGWLRMTLAR